MPRTYSARSAFQFPVNASSALLMTPSSMKKVKSRFFMPLKSPSVPINGASTAQIRVPQEVAYPQNAVASTSLTPF